MKKLALAILAVLAFALPAQAQNILSLSASSPPTTLQVLVSAPAPGNAWDWVTISNANKELVNWRYLDSTTNNQTAAHPIPVTVNIPMPTANGQYTVQYNLNNAYTPYGNSVTFSVPWTAPPPSASLSGITLSNSSFTCATAGVVGAITVQGTGSIAGATLSLTGTDAAQFSLSSTTVPSNLIVSATPAGCPRSYSLNIVATLAGASGSPKTQAFTITGSSQGGGGGGNCAVNSTGDASQYLNGTCKFSALPPVMSVITAPPSGACTYNPPYADNAIQMDAGIIWVCNSSKTWQQIVSGVGAPGPAGPAGPKGDKGDQGIPGTTSEGVLPPGSCAAHDSRYEVSAAAPPTSRLYLCHPATLLACRTQWGSLTLDLTDGYNCTGSRRTSEPPPRELPPPTRRTR